MLSGERRGVSSRRGMTVLGKIPVVPKPINLPSQRSENRGLDPNVEIVPRGSLSWGSAGRSPPTSGNVWGNNQQISSPPASNVPWGASTKNAGGLVGSSSRPSSAGSGTRPSTADSSVKPQDLANTANAWSLSMSRPSSASGILGQSHAQLSLNRPRSAETRSADTQRTLSQFSESSTGTSSQAWGPSGNKRSVDDLSHSGRFTLSHGDFPSLGSEKTHELCPQQRIPATASAEVERREKSAADSWKKDSALTDGSSLGPDNSWRGECPPRSLSGHYPAPESWQKEGQFIAPAHGSNDHWARNGPPPGPYNPGVSPIPPGRFPYDSAGFMHQQRFGAVQMPPLHGGHLIYERHGDGYSNVPFMRPPGMMPERPGPPFGPSVYPGPIPYESFGLYSGVSGYHNLDEREMMVNRANRPGFYGGFPHRPGPVESFNLYRPGMGFAPLQNPHPSRPREGVEVMGYDGESFHESRVGEAAVFRHNVDVKSGGNKVYPVHAGKEEKGDSDLNSWEKGRSAGNEMSAYGQGPGFQGVSERPLHGHQDWGAADFIDEPMDFSKPVFEDEKSAEVEKEVNKTYEGMDISSLDSKKSYVQKKGSMVDSLAEKSSSSNVTLLHRKPHVLAVEEVGDLRKEVSEEVAGIETIEEHFTVGNSGSAKDVTLGVKSASTVLAVADVLVCDPPPKESVIGSDANLTPTSCAQANSLDGAVSHGNPGLCFGNLPSESSPSLLTCTLSLNSTEVSSFSEKDSRSFPADFGSAIIVDNLPAKKVASENAKSSIGGAENLDNGKSNEQLSNAGGMDNSPLVPDIGISAGERKLDTTLSTGGMHMQHSREDFRPKSKPSPHDVEKEWRPKAVRGQRGEKPKSSSAKTFSQIKIHTVSSSSDPGIASEPARFNDKSGLDIESATLSDSYDYEAQRARMKEIAAQRALQLQKEEEERTKEQKAKALAKLEELNRRTVVSTAQPSVEPNSELSEVGSCDLAQPEPHAPVPVHVESNECLALVRALGDKKKEQLSTHLHPDPQSNSMASSSDSVEPVDVSTELSQADKTGCQSEDGNKHLRQDHTNSKAPHLRYRTKPLVSQSNPTSEQIASTKETESENVGMEATVSNRSIDDKLTVTVALPHNTTSEVTGNKVLGSQPGQSVPFKKKRNNRNLKSRGKIDLEDNSVGCDVAIESDDIEAEVTKVDDAAACGAVDVKNTAALSGSVLNSRDNVSPTLSDDVFTSVWKDNFQGHEENSKGAGQLHAKRISQRHPMNKRPPRDRVAQDIRSVEKHGSGDGMVWAPVRVTSNNNGGGSKFNEDSIPDTSNDGVEEEGNNQQLTKVKRAELERYTPKPVMKQHAQNQDVAESATSGQTSIIQAENETINRSRSSFMPRNSAEYSQKQTLYSSSQHVNYRTEGKLHEFPSKSGRYQASWRQRGPGIEQANADGIEFLAHAGDDFPVPSNLERETWGRVSQNRQQEQGSLSNQQRARNSVGDCGSRPTNSRNNNKSQEENTVKLQQEALGIWSSGSVYSRNNSKLQPEGNTEKLQQEAKSNSPQKKHHSHAVPIHENSSQKVVAKDENIEGTDSSIPVLPARPHGNFEKFDVARHKGRPIGHLQEDASTLKSVRGQQKPVKSRELSSRLPEPVVSQEQEREDSQSKERRGSHQNKSSNPSSRPIPPHGRQAPRSYSQRSELETSHSHFSTPHHNVVVSSTSSQDTMSQFSGPSPQKVSDQSPLGSSSRPDVKSGSFNMQVREKNKTLVSTQQFKNSQTRRPVFHGGYDHEQRDNSNSYHQRLPDFDQQAELKESGFDKPQRTVEKHEIYQPPRATSSASSKQHRAISGDKNSALGTSHHQLRHNDSQDQISTFEAGNRHTSSVTNQHSNKASLQDEHWEESGPRPDNEKKNQRSQWDGEGGVSSNFRGRELGFPRRGKFGGRGNMRGPDFDFKMMPSAKRPPVTDGIANRNSSQVEVRHEISN